MEAARLDGRPLPKSKQRMKVTWMRVMAVRRERSRHDMEILL